MKKINIVIIEDEFSIRENMLEILKLKGFEVIAVDNGESGLELIKQTNPEIVLCDIMLPGIDGYEVYKKTEEYLKESGFLNKKLTSFIFITAKSTRADFRNAMIMGADDYLTKPFTVDELISTVNIRIKKTQELLDQFTINESFDSSVLTKTELKVLNLISQGYSTKKISELLFVTKKIIENHRANICQKLNLAGPYSLTGFALRLLNSRKTNH